MQTIVGCDTEGFGRARLTWNGDGLGWAAFVHRFVGSCAGWGMGMTGLGWAGLVCGFVGSWVALGFVWVSFPRATSEGFLFSTSTAGVETRDPRTYRGRNRGGIRTIDSVSLR